MPQFSTERRVRHPADQMFALIADIEKYPEFLPMCEKLTVRGRTNEDGREVLVADMTIAYAVVRETFTTRVTLDRPALTIDADYLDGPFHHLDSQWSFVPEGEGACLVRFTIDYEFKSRMLTMVMGSAFEGVFRKFGEAFEKRADAVYGTHAP
ncbi:MAG: type II toxin-antitoxin system RatA family toxin [Bauldia sp.]